MSNWHNKQIDAAASIRANYYGRVEPTSGAWKVDDYCQLNQKMVVGEAVIPPYTLGRISEVNTNGIVVEFDKFGAHQISQPIADQFLVPYTEKTTSDLIRNSMFKSTPNFSPAMRTGAVALDETGTEYTVVQANPFTGSALARDANGALYGFAPNKLTIKESSQTLPFQPGNRVVVQSIDPQLNSLRRYAVQQGEDARIIGQMRLIEFAFYPTGEGRVMYRVLLEMGGKKDFSESELSPAMMAPETGYTGSEVPSPPVQGGMPENFVEPSGGVKPGTIAKGVQGIYNKKRENPSGRREKFPSSGPSGRREPSKYGASPVHMGESVKYKGQKGVVISLNESTQHVKLAMNSGCFVEVPVVEMGGLPPTSAAGGPSPTTTGMGAPNPPTSEKRKPKVGSRVKVGEDLGVVVKTGKEEAYVMLDDGDSMTVNYNMMDTVSEEIDETVAMGMVPTLGLTAPSMSTAVSTDTYVEGEEVQLGDETVKIIGFPDIRNTSVARVMFSSGQEEVIQLPEAKKKDDDDNNGNNAAAVKGGDDDDDEGEYGDEKDEPEEKKKTKKESTGTQAFARKLLHSVREGKSVSSGILQRVEAELDSASPANVVEDASSVGSPMQALNMSNLLAGGPKMDKPEGV